MDNQQVNMEIEICHNCKKEIPQNNYLMHVAHCARNMTVCPVCGDAVPKGNLKEHKIQQHSMVECKDCRFKVQSGALQSHQLNACGKRITPCPYCELELPKCDLTEHENYCGARTERCDACGELVMLKYQKLHVESNHGFLKLDDEPGPMASWESPPARRQNSIDLGAVAASLPRPAERNVNTASSANKTDYKTPLANEARETLRSYVLPYDPTEDLRAKVKLARHDLNEIKQSILMTEEKKDKIDNKYRNERYDVNLTATAKSREKFTTNLVPFEKNKSFKVNTLPLDEAPKKFYNYLGEKEEVPENNVFKVQNILGDNGLGYDKNVRKTSINDLRKFDNAQPSVDANRANIPLATEKSPKKNLGAIPRSTRRRAPPPPIAVPSAEPPPNAEEVNLPCEFCDTMVPASNLVLHETGCRPHLAQVNVNVTNTFVSSQSDSPEVQLPCEFCFTLVPASKLLSHQARCEN